MATCCVPKSACVVVNILCEHILVYFMMMQNDPQATPLSKVNRKFLQVDKKVRKMFVIENIFLFVIPKIALFYLYV